MACSEIDCSIASALGNPLHLISGARKGCNMMNVLARKL
jgi:hypothetical protein